MLNSDGVIATVAILVQAVDGGGVEVGSIVGGDEAAPCRAVIPGVAVVQTGFFVVVVATIANGVGTTIILNCTKFCKHKQKSWPANASQPALRGCYIQVLITFISKVT